MASNPGLFPEATWKVLCCFANTDSTGKDSTPSLVRTTTFGEDLLVVVSLAGGVRPLTGCEGVPLIEGLIGCLVQDGGVAIGNLTMVERVGGTGLHTHPWLGTDPLICPVLGTIINQYCWLPLAAWDSVLNGPTVLVDSLT